MKMDRIRWDKCLLCQDEVGEYDFVTFSKVLYSDNLLNAGRFC